MKSTFITSAIILSITTDSNPCTVLHHTDECGTNAQMEVCTSESNFSNKDVKYKFISFKEKGFFIDKIRFFKRKILFDSEKLYFTYRILGNKLIYLTQFDEPSEYTAGSLQEATFFCLSDTIGTVHTTYANKFGMPPTSKLIRKWHDASDTLYTYKISYNGNCSHCILVEELVVNNKFQFKQVTTHSSGGEIRVNACIPSPDGDVTYK